MKIIIDYSKNLITPFKYKVEILNIDKNNINNLEVLLTKVLHWVEPYKQEQKIIGFLDNDSINIMRFFYYILILNELKNIDIDFKIFQH